MREGRVFQEVISLRVVGRGSGHGASPKQRLFTRWLIASRFGDRGRGMLRNLGILHVTRDFHLSQSMEIKKIVTAFFTHAYHNPFHRLEGVVVEDYTTVGES